MDLEYTAADEAFRAEVREWLAVDVCAAAATVAEPPYELADDQALFLYTRSDTIYAGSNEIQRNIIAERMLGLPRG